MRLAFFDLDGTIISGSTGGDLTVAMLRSGRIKPLHALYVAMVGTGQRLGVTHGQDLLRRAASFFEGMPEREVRALLGRLYDEHLARRIYPATRRLLSHHRALGDEVALISASPTILLERFAEDLDAQHCIGSSQAVVDGCLSGVAEEPISYGAGKVTLARALAAERGASLREASFYSDSISDLPLLEAVGYPHVINPDPRLAVTAWRRGWPITVALGVPWPSEGRRP